MRVQSLGQEDPLEKEMATHSGILAWKIPWTEEPGRLQSKESQADTTEHEHDFKKQTKKSTQNKQQKKNLANPWPQFSSSLFVFFNLETLQNMQCWNATSWKMAQGPNLQGLNHILFICKVKSLPTLEFPWILVKTLLFVSNKNSTQTPSN